tara:strand:+ start:333 stop:1160 length:828 start_codon:yes stop_codon:yes gene_type:complete
MFTTFYNETIRKTVVAFGSLFDEIFVVRKNKDGTTNKRVMVPISYASKEKFIRMLDEFPDTKGQDGAAAIASVLPRMGFAITSINYDGARKRNTVYKRFKYTSTDGEIDSQFSEVPYNISFQLAIAARTMDDALQIVEQIVPYFTPEFCISVNFTDFNTKVDIPITIQAVNPEIDYQGDTSTQRSVIFTIDFVAYSYVFSPTKQEKYIKTTDITNFTSFFNLDGSITGPTAAASRIITTITGPSGAESLPPVAGITQEIFQYPNSLSITGATLDG